MAWYFYSLIAMVSFSGMMLFIKKARNLGFSSGQVNLFLFGLVFLGFLVANCNHLGEIYYSNNFWRFAGLLALAAIFAILANWADFEAVGLAPNPGYAQIIKYGNVLLIAVLSIWLFKSEFKVKKMLGAISIIGGIALVVL